MSMFSGKLNPFSRAFRERFSETYDAAMEYMANKDLYNALASRDQNAVPEIFIAQIAGASPASNFDVDGAAWTGNSRNLWRYNFSVFGPNQTVNYSLWAVNGAEVDNVLADGSQSYGVETSSASPEVELLPIGNNIRNPLVLMFRTPAPVAYRIPFYTAEDAVIGYYEIKTRYFFSGGNDVSVEC